MSVLVPSLGLIMFAAVFLVLPLGFPVGFTLMGTALFFSLIGHLLGAFDLPLLTALPQRLIGLMENDLLQAIPLFVYLRVIMQRTTLAQELLEAMSGLFGSHAGGLSISTVILGALLAPTTGAVGASVLTLGLLALPAMLSAGYRRSLACGVECSAGTLGTVLPPSIILIVLADLMRGANAEAQVMRGEDVHGALVIKDIYVGMLAPVGILLALYLVYVVATALLRPADCPPLPPERRIAFIALLLGSIVTGRVYTVEAAALGAIVATIYAWARSELTWTRWAETVRTVMRLTGMMFLLLMGASTFTLVFRGLNGVQMVHGLLGKLPGGLDVAILAVFAVTFCFGFFLDALEIVLLVVPIALPPLLALGAHPIWLTALMALTVQTSFLMPPSGFALFFLRSIAPRDVGTRDIYAGALPFIVIQLVAIVLLWRFPGLATALPAMLD
ncbi:MAG: TRAP transporter large permease subunit [Betaproteobacteria bacterium]|nr:MAG: TRAP transporter large permease subunit [Betaproteobacteria bacterium]